MVFSLTADGEIDFVHSGKARCQHLGCTETHLTYKCPSFCETHCCLHVPLHPSDAMKRFARNDRDLTCHVHDCNQLRVRTCLRFCRTHCCFGEHERWSRELTRIFRQRRRQTARIDRAERRAEIRAEWLRRGSELRNRIRMNIGTGGEDESESNGEREGDHEGEGGGVGEAQAEIMTGVEQITKVTSVGRGGTNAIDEAEEDVGAELSTNSRKGEGVDDGVCAEQQRQRIQRQHQPRHSQCFGRTFHWGQQQESGGEEESERDVICARRSEGGRGNLSM